MLASATEVEVELHVPNDVSTFFGVTWAQDLRDGKIFIKAFPRGVNGRIGLLEATGLVEIADCLTAIDGISLSNESTLREAMASIRAARSPLSLRFARYAPPSPLSSSSPSLAGSLNSSNGPSRSGSTGTLSVGVDTTSPQAAHGRDTDGVEDPALDDVLNSALVLGLGERVSGIQKRNARLLQAVDRVGQAAASKREGVERVASAAAGLTAAAAALPRALRTLSVARQEASALCEAMARLDELLAAREKAQVARRRNYGDGELLPAAWSDAGGDRRAGNELSR